MAEITLAEYRRRACTGKTPLGEAAARSVAARCRDQGDPLVPYRCAFCHGWHVGHDVGVVMLGEIARLLRARSGNAPAAPGSGSTRRSRRKVARREASNLLPVAPVADDDASPVGL